MKIKLDKDAFTLSEKELIKKFKTEWATPSFDEIRTAATAAAQKENIELTRLVVVDEIELTKNRYELTYWIKVIIQGYKIERPETCDVFAEIEFDYVQAITASPEDRIDHIAKIFKESK